MHWLRIGLAASLIVLFMACWVVAQSTQTDGPAVQPPKETGKAASVVPPIDLRDPTEVGPKLKEAMDKGKLAPGTGPSSRLPQVFLKGRVLTKDRPPLAMLEVDGKLYIVAQGSTLAGPGNLLLRVSEVTRTEVRIEVGPLKEIITLR